MLTKQARSRDTTDVEGEGILRKDASERDVLGPRLERLYLRVRQELRRLGWARPRPDDELHRLFHECDSEIGMLSKSGKSVFELPLAERKKVSDDARRHWAKLIGVAEMVSGLEVSSRFKSAKREPSPRLARPPRLAMAEALALRDLDSCEEAYLLEYEFIPEDPVRGRHNRE